MSVPLQRPEGEVGTVTGRIANGTVGEVIVPFHGGRDAFYAHPVDDGAVFDVGEEVLVIRYEPPRTVYVTCWPPEELK